MPHCYSFSLARASLSHQPFACWTCCFMTTSSISDMKVSAYKLPAYKPECGELEGVLFVEWVTEG
eukprot:7478348-Pyramimonas_sp.AAC.1